MKQFKNIVFDVGEVLLEYRWKDMMMDHGMTEEEALNFGNTIFDDPLWSEYDLAVLSEEEILLEYQKKYPEIGENLKWFISNGEQMRVKRPDVWKRVHRLKEQGYKIYLLSNYSQHLFEKHTKDADFMNDIDGKVVSYQLHIVKPDERIYQHLFLTYGLNPKECLFFDDRAENTAASKKAGMEAVTVTSRQFLIEMLDYLLETGTIKK